VKKLRHALMLFTLSAMVFLNFAYPAKAYDLEKHIGLYKVVETKCEVTKGGYNPCPTIKFFELVKGRFYGIGTDDMAFIHWKVDQKDLIAAYEAGLIKNHKKLLMNDNKIWLTNRENKTETQKEFFTIKDGKISDYQFIYIHENKAGKSVSRNFYYKLTPISRGEIGDTKLLYPDNSDDTVKALPSFEKDVKFYKNSNDSIYKSAVIDKNLYCLEIKEYDSKNLLLI
jgi:hypothetical protein